MEGRYVAVINRKAPYLRKKDLQVELGICRSTADKLFKGVEDGIRSGRYDRYSVAGNYVNLFAVIDYLKYGDQLKDKNMRKYVPAYNPVMISESCGFSQKILEVEKYVDTNNYSGSDNGNRIPAGDHLHGYILRQQADQ